jgi:hypothetical protein
VNIAIENAKQLLENKFDNNLYISKKYAVSFILAMKQDYKNISKFLNWDIVKEIYCKAYSANIALYTPNGYYLCDSGITTPISYTLTGQSKYILYNNIFKSIFI